MEFMVIVVIFALLTILFSAIRPKRPNSGVRRGSRSGFMHNPTHANSYDSYDVTPGSSHNHCGGSSHSHSSSYDGGSCDSGGGDGGGGGGE